MEDIAIPVAAYLCAAPGAARPRAALETFAAAHCMRIARWFEDADWDEDRGHTRAQAGVKDGPAAVGACVSPATRPALTALMAAAASPGRDFEFVLTPDAVQLDLAHPGDWQARDAALRAAGCPPLYTAEPFRNDGRAIGRRLKALFDQQGNAERGRRIAAAKRRWAAQGFHTGAPAPYGLRRQMIGWNQEGRAMGRGEGRPHGRYRSVLIPGPAGEVDTVRRVVALCARHGLTAEAIARRLNREERAPEGSPGEGGGRRRPWDRNSVLRIMANQLYTGVRVLGRRARTPADGEGQEERELRLEGACEPIVSRALFDAARLRRQARRRRFTDAEILEGLKRVLATHGVIARELVDRDPELPGWITVGTRFGGMAAAFARIGYVAPGDWEKRRAMGRVRGSGGASLQFPREHPDSPNALGDR